MVMSKYIQLTEVTLGYGDRNILSDINLEAGHGQIVGIIGPNGSGKSTILKALCGLNRPTSGRIILDGTEISKLSREEMARKIGVVPQSPPQSNGPQSSSVVVHHDGGAAVDAETPHQRLEAFRLQDHQWNGALWVREFDHQVQVHCSWNVTSCIAF